MINQEQIGHLLELLQQDEVWVGRARWLRWLDTGDRADTMAISALVLDDRIAACAWLRQQRHVLHATVEGGERAPEGWVRAQPLYQALERG